MNATCLAGLVAALSLGVHSATWAAALPSPSEPESGGLTLAYSASSLLAGSHIERRVRPGLLLSGGLLLGAGFISSCVKGSSAPSGSYERQWLALPILGPVVAGVQSISSSRNCSGGLIGLCSDVAKATGVLLILDAVGQAVGLGLLIWGLVGKQVVVPVGSTAIALTPLLSSGGVGLSAAARFW